MKRDWWVGILRKFAPKKVSLSIPFGIGKVEWEVNQTQSRAAWSLYVELVTRIAVEPLEADTGLLREALNSLYSLFGSAIRS